MKRSPEELQAVKEKILSALHTLRAEERTFIRISGRAGYLYSDERKVDKALQALRKDGKIKYSHSKRVWEVL